MSTSRISKVTSVSAQLHNKPYNNLYEQKKQKPYRANEQILVDKAVVDKYNELITEVLETMPYSEAWKLLRTVFVEMGIRKES